MRATRANMRRISSTARRDARIPRVDSGRLVSSLTSTVGIAAASRSAALPPSSPKDFFAFGVHGRGHDDDRTDSSIASALRAATRRGINIVPVADDSATTNAEVASATTRLRVAIATVDGADRGSQRP